MPRVPSHWGSPQKSQQCHKYLLRYSTFASERPKGSTSGAKLVSYPGRHLPSVRLCSTSSKIITSSEMVIRDANGLHLLYWQVAKKVQHRSQVHLFLSSNKNVQSIWKTLRCKPDVVNIISEYEEKRKTALKKIDIDLAKPLGFTNGCASST